MHPVLAGILDELNALDASRKALRSFGLVVGGVFAAVAGVIVWRSGGTFGTASAIFASLGGALILGGVLMPSFLRPIHRAWMALALALGYVMTRVLLTLVFVLLFIPIGLTLRLLGKDLLDRRLDPHAPTYWKPRDPKQNAPERMTRYF